MINLHALVRSPINMLHPDETVTLYRSVDIVNQLGVIKTVYDEGESVIAQIQSLSNDDLYANHREGENDISRNCYLFSSVSTADKPASIIRPLSRTGDMLQRSDGTWWLVTALKEDFSLAGWVNVSITLQVNPPDFSASPWFEG